jgi:hypothetical protein
MDSLADLGKVDACKRLLNPADGAICHITGLIHIAGELIQLCAELYHEVVGQFSSCRLTARGYITAAR